MAQVKAPGGLALMTVLAVALGAVAYEVVDFLNPKLFSAITGSRPRETKPIFRPFLRPTP